MSLPISATVSTKSFSSPSFNHEEIMLLSISKMSEADREKFRRSNDIYKTWEVGRRLFDDPSKRAIDKEDNYQFWIRINNENYDLFRKKIEALTSDEIFFDSGCGNGVAGEDYAKAYPKGATFIGVTLTRPDMENEDAKWLKRDRSPRLHLFLHDILEFPTTSLHGRVSVITDIHGAFRYSGQPSKALTKMAEMLKIGGTLFLVFSGTETVDVSTYEDKISSCKKKELIAQGSSALLFLYLSTIRGLKVIGPEEGITPKLIQERFGLCKDSSYDYDTVPEIGYWNCCWVFERTEEPLALDPLYKEGDDSQVYDTHNFQKFFWQVSERNKYLLDKLYDFDK